MSAKNLILGALVGGIVLFCWGAITHAVLPQPIHYFVDEMAVVETMRANAPTNGIYFGPHGVFVSVALLPDLGDKTKNILPNVLRQFLSDALAAMLLAIFLTRLPGTVLGRAGWAAIAGLVAVVLKLLPYWNWYGFPPAFIGMEAFDLVGKFFLSALVLGALRKKLTPTAA